MSLITHRIWLKVKFIAGSFYIDIAKTDFPNNIGGETKDNRGRIFSLISIYALFPMLYVPMNIYLLWMWYRTRQWDTLVNKLIYIQRICGILYFIGCLVDYFFRLDGMTFSFFSPAKLLFLLDDLLQVSNLYLPNIPTGHGHSQVDMCQVPHQLPYKILSMFWTSI